MLKTLVSSKSSRRWQEFETQGSYRVRYVVETDGLVVTRQSRNSYVKILSIRYDPSRIVTSITSGRKPEIVVPKFTNPKITVLLDDGLISRCMESLDSSRSDDYHDWIKIGCILYTIDRENGFQRWNEFSKQSYKYDESYVSRTWDSFKDYNYTIGSLIYLAREDDEDFTIKDPNVEKQSYRKLIKKCKEKGIRGYMTMSFGELCSVLRLPPQEKNESLKNIRTPVEVVLMEVKSGERTTFKSIYSAAKFVGRNPGSISLKKNTCKIIKSAFDNVKYTVEIEV